MFNSTNTVFAGGILVLAGLYQLTPLKKACLEHCRNPIAYLSQNWRDGSGGALVMGLQHGIYCLGCCWGLMVILFFGGIMNLYWIIGLAMIVFLEKLLPVGPRLGQITGALLLVWGATFLYSALV
jgi:predicted metal-binding membrane protein